MTVVSGFWNVATIYFVDVVLTAGIKATIVFALAAVASATVARRSAEVRRLLWVGAFVGTAVLALSGSILPSISIGEPTRAVLNLHTDAVGSPAPERSVVSDGTTTGVADHGGSAVSAPGDGRIWTVVPPLVWFVGLLLGMARLGYGVAQREALLHRGRPAGDSWRATLRALRTPSARTAMPVLVESPDVTVPQAWGVRREVIVLPSGSRSWSEEQRRLSLLHELEHLDRHDPALVFMARLTCWIYWFNPVVWTAYRRLRLEMERACDQRVVSAHGPADRYAAYLLGMARRMVPSLDPMGLGLVRRKDLEKRLRWILDPRNLSTKRGLGRRLVVPALMVASLTLGALSPAGQEPTIVLDAPSGFRWVAPNESGTLRVIDVALRGTVTISADTTAVVPVERRSGFLRVTELGSAREIHRSVEVRLTPSGLEWTDVAPHGTATSPATWLAHRLPEVVRHARPWEPVS